MVSLGALLGAELRILHSLFLRNSLRVACGKTFLASFH